MNDDNEPLTVEWLESVGSREPNGMDYSAPPTMTLPGAGYGVLVQVSPVIWEWCRGSRVIATIRSRGQLRKLCDGLGHPLKGGGRAARLHPRQRRPGEQAHLTNGG